MWPFKQGAPGYDWLGKTHSRYTGGAVFDVFVLDTLFIQIQLSNIVCFCCFRFHWPLFGGSDGFAPERLDGDAGAERGVEISGLGRRAAVCGEPASEREPEQSRGTAWSLHGPQTSHLQIPTDGPEPGGDARAQSHVSGELRYIYWIWPSYTTSNSSTSAAGLNVKGRVGLNLIISKNK